MAMPDVCGASPASASFLAMWMAMMVPMMMPSLAPALWRYRLSIIGGGRVHRAGLSLTAGLGYFFVWALIGLAVSPLGVSFAPAGMRFGPGAVLLAAGLVQSSAWKRKRLEGCRAHTECCLPPAANAPAAWLRGMHLGVRCVLCCGNLMAISLVAGMMDWRVMAAVTAAITVERLAPAPGAVARGIGVMVIGAGVFRLAQAAGW